MIEVVIICDRCGKQNGDGKAIGTGLSIANTAKVHLCGSCTSDFWSWVDKHKKEAKTA